MMGTVLFSYPPPPTSRDGWEPCYFHILHSPSLSRASYVHLLLCDSGRGSGSKRCVPPHPNIHVIVWEEMGKRNVGMGSGGYG